jgi:hypothetical protein
MILAFYLPPAMFSIGPNYISTELSAISNDVPILRRGEAGS